MGAETWKSRRWAPATDCFNEAAPRWARKRHAVVVRHAEVQGFNEAAPRWARKRGAGLHGSVGIVVASMRPRHDGRGNVQPGSETITIWHASMRPRHDGRGNRRMSRGPRPRRLSFNEAAPRWARKQPGAPLVRDLARSFNEAAPRWARKLLPGYSE